ncbi:MAG: TIM barrel protein [Clostridia bacterium]|nr:TIM barrel protein [Clostridia bacterium]
MVRFGPAGNDVKFYAEGNQSSVDAPRWLAGIGLNAYEISFGRGIRMTDKTAQIIGKQAELYDVRISVHAPYYINLGSMNKDVVARSKANMKEGIALAKSVGVNRIIFHPGGGHENTEQGRKAAVKQLIDSVNEFTSEIDMGDVRLYPEIGGKTASLGSLDEIIEICSKCKYCYPCIDIAHLHAREIGSIVSADVLKEKLLKIKNALPDKFPYIHFHAYTIEYNDKGEVKHLVHGTNMSNGQVGRPNLDEFVSVLKELGLDPWVVSEASDSQEIGAKYMHDLYVK